MELMCTIEDTSPRIYFGEVIELPLLIVEFKAVEVSMAFLFYKIRNLSGFRWLVM